MSDDDGYWLELIDMACQCRTWPVQVEIAFNRGRCGLCGYPADKPVSAPYKSWVPGRKGQYR